MIIRDCEREDLERVVALMFACSAEEYGMPSNAQARPEVLDLLIAQHRQGQLRIIVAEEDGIRGFVYCEYNSRGFPNAGNIIQLYVEPESRRKGTGKEMLERVIYETTATGLPELYIKIKETEAQGLATLVNLGFVQQPRTQGIFVLLRKELTRN